MNKTILVTGAKGQLGSEIEALSSQYKEAVFHFTDRSSLDITKRSDIENFCDENSIDVIINCAAYTSVDKAENDVESADAINHLAVKYLAEIAKSKNISLVHVSTDYVFDGKTYTPYCEEDAIAPQGVYGKTKQLGEEAIFNSAPTNSIIIRTSWVYSSFGNNFVKTMLRLGKERAELGVVFDQIGTPTYAKDLAQAILEVIPRLKNSTVELFHYSNEGVCSWYDFAKTIFDMSNISCKLKPIETKEYPTAAIRPHYSLLNKSKFKRTFNSEIPYWKDSLQACLHVLKD